MTTRRQQPDTVRLTYSQRGWLRKIVHGRVNNWSQGGSITIRALERKGLIDGNSAIAKGRDYVTEWERKDAVTRQGR